MKNQIFLDVLKKIFNYNLIIPSTLSKPIYNSTSAFKKQWYLSAILSAYILTNITTNAYAAKEVGTESNSISSATDTLTKNNYNIVFDEELTLGGASLGGRSERSIFSSSLNINTSSISTSTKDSFYSISLHGGSIVANANNNVFYNSIKIKSSNISTAGPSSKIFLAGGDIFGNGNQTATGNSIEINDSTLSTTGGSSSHISLDGGSVFGSGNHIVTGNSIKLDRVSITTGSNSDISLFGGSATGTTGKRIVTDNSLAIVNSTLTSGKDILLYGGFASSNTSLTHNVTNNKVTLSGIVNATANNGDISLSGGVSSNTSDARTRNTLILDKATVILNASVNSTVQNFEHYTFTPTRVNLTNGGTPMLSAKRINLGTNAKLEIKAIGGGTPFVVGDTFTLLNATILLDGEFDNIDNPHTLYQGITTKYTITTEQTGNGKNAGTVIATIAVAGTAMPQTEVPAQARLIPIATLNQASNLLSNAGIQSAETSVANLQKKYMLNSNKTARLNDSYNNSSDFALFAIFEGGDLNYNDINTDIEYLSFLTGIAKQTNISYGNLLYGIFAEQGSADIKSTNIINSKSTSSYYGAGIFAKLSNDNLYGEFSLRAGKSEVEQNSQDFVGFIGTNINYDTSSLYYGSHIALGYLKKLNLTNIDIYSKYSYIFQKGDSATITGANYIFEDINSHRLRLGIKNSFNYSETSIPYINISLEKEFNTEASYSTNGLTAGVPTLKGNIGIFEVGIKIEPSSELPISLSFGLEAFSGTKEGVSVRAQFGYLY